GLLVDGYQHVEIVRRGSHRFRPDANLIIAVPPLDPGAELPVSVHVIPQTVADGGEEIAAAFDPLPLLPADLPRNEVLQWRQPLLACFPCAFILTPDCVIMQINKPNLFDAPEEYP